MPLPIIARNTYPLHPTGYAVYWRSKGPRREERLFSAGKVPIWASYHDGGGDQRIVHLLLVRVLPQLEVMLMGSFRREILVEEIERNIRKRLSKPRWCERKWWVSHIVYLAQPPKRTPKTRHRPPRYERFCMGRLTSPRGLSHMLAFIPVARLKLNILPESRDALADVRFEVDLSNAQQQGIRLFVGKLAELERWERQIVNEALGHLCGDSYLEALARGSEQIAERIHGVQKSHAGTDIRSLLIDAAEDFRPVGWLQDPGEPDHRRVCQTLLTISRFPMGMGPDPEFSVRPWVPGPLQGILSPVVPVGIWENMAMELLPDPQNHSVAIRWIINALLPYTENQP